MFEFSDRPSAGSKFLFADALKCGDEMTIRHLILEANILHLPAAPDPCRSTDIQNELLPNVEFDFVYANRIPRLTKRR